jgi:hypothetical protein
MDLMGANWVHVPQDRDRRQDLENTVHNEPSSFIRNEEFLNQLQLLASYHVLNSFWRSGVVITCEEEYRNAKSLRAHQNRPTGLIYVLNEE